MTRPKTVTRLMGRVDTGHYLTPEEGQKLVSYIRMIEERMKAWAARVATRERDVL